MWKDNSLKLEDISITIQAIHTMVKAWAFEDIPYLRQQVNYRKEVLCPRMLRWLSAKADKNAKFLDLFTPLKDAKLSGCDYFDWYEERHPSQVNRIIWGLLKKVKAFKEKRN
ncbi:uncharacterized protein LOC124891214 [Capsicum annuum]|uniref:uncharacterized protein LOC124891214 n=1 Tax=Capsicum annuum TaxID=4072 RepID=UPI001FB0683B|nr:uncharacterized protein LOC124891214 [Capsicum annuum]